MRFVPRVLLVSMVLALGAARGQEASPAPLPWGAERGSAHVPYAQGDCSACHENRGPNPGPPAQAGDGLCFSCHEGLTQHAHAFRNCTRCHNAHDSARKHLLRNDLDQCEGCHASKAS